jgi:lipopolysaccharide transport system ATP-binding protein
MTNVVIKAEHLSKYYRLGEIGGGTVQEDLSRWWAGVRGRPDPSTRLSGNGERASNELWALRDVSFDVRQGEVLGIIGRNGAGKSTLLKILSRTTAPTTGRVSIRGRIASLLEVGTGFHPELTGRENIFLNGAILGMKKAEIGRKLEEVIDFSGVEQFIDTPVKRYSSGMYVRLAFAVAAHLEPEILILDEVLAVGDSAFQKKCIGKMEAVGKSGRTVIFVSHQMSMIQKMTSSCILMNSGNIQVYGATDTCIEAYLRDQSTAAIASSLRADGREFQFTATDSNGVQRTSFPPLSEIVFKLICLDGAPIPRVDLQIAIYTSSEYRLLTLSSRIQSEAVLELSQVSALQARWQSCPLAPGDYYVAIGLYEGGLFRFGWDRVLKLTIESTDVYGTGKNPDGGMGQILSLCAWTQVNA